MEQHSIASADPNTLALEGAFEIGGRDHVTLPQALHTLVGGHIH
jgi:hypothetical protein